MEVNIQNIHYKKIRQCYILTITCANCNSFICTYQKVGRTNLVKLYLERIVTASIDLKTPPGAIFCPTCGNQIAIKYTVKKDNKLAYRLVPSMSHKSKYVK